MNNQEYTGEFVDHKPRLLKKIYVNKEKITIDHKKIEEYGEQNYQDQSNKNKFLQNWLSRPLETSNKNWLNLPFKSTGSGSLPPYLRIDGKCIINEKEESITLKLKGNDPKNKKKKLLIESKLDISSSKENFSEDMDIIIRLDKKNYTIGGHPLFDAYVKSKIITNNMVFNSNLFNKISKYYPRGDPTPSRADIQMTVTQFILRHLKN